MNEGRFRIEKNVNSNLDEFVYFFEYGGKIRKAIIQYKFRDKAYMYKSIVKIMTKNKNLVEFLKSYDIIIPVPLSRKRKKQRGYNQSLLIANEIANWYNKQQMQNELLVNTSCLIKAKDIVEQSSLNKEERENNIQGVYILKNAQILENKRILIVDDIYTTGNTVRECSQMIKNANPSKIGVLTIAHTTLD